MTFHLIRFNVSPTMKCLNGKGKYFNMHHSGPRQNLEWPILYKGPTGSSNMIHEYHRPQNRFGEAQQNLDQTP